MSSNENVTGSPVGRKRAQKTGAKGLHPLHDAAMRLADLGRGGKKLVATRDLVAMLLAHGARAWRATQPDARIHLHVTSPNRKHPICMRLR
jgi:hypothetical protein